MKKTKVHLISGFLGTGKTTALKSLMAQKDPNEKWVIIVNEFGEIGIDGAVLSDNGIPVAEIAGGCLCCTAGPQMGVTVQKMLRDAKPDRLMIEASGLAHAASVIDELKTKPLDSLLEIGAVFTVVDPRQFINPDYAQQALYKDQIGICDVLVASKTDLCTPEQLAEFHDKAAKLFPPKAKVVEVQNAQLDIQWLDIPVIEKSRYRLKALPDNTMGFQSQGFTFPAGRDFDGEKLTNFFNDLPNMTEGLVRAKGVFQVLGTWVWLNWVDGQWGANQVSWRRDSRFELIAKSFDADLIEQKLKDALIRVEHPDYTGDSGFKIFQTADNFRQHPDKDFSPEQPDLPLNDELSEEQLQTLLTTWTLYDGAALTTPVEPVRLGAYTAYLCEKRLYLMNAGFTSADLLAFIRKLDDDADFNPNRVIVFGSNMASAMQHELDQAVRGYANKKEIELNVVIRV